MRLQAGHECWLRVTLAGEQLFETFIRRFAEGIENQTDLRTEEENHERID